jgi:hypothetical protein
MPTVSLGASPTTLGSRLDLIRFPTVSVAMFRYRTCRVNRVMKHPPDLEVFFVLGKEVFPMLDGLGSR